MLQVYAYLFPPYLRDHISLAQAASKSIILCDSSLVEESWAERQWVRMLQALLVERCLSCGPTRRGLLPPWQLRSSRSQTSQALSQRLGQFLSSPVWLLLKRYAIVHLDVCIACTCASRASVNTGVVMCRAKVKVPCCMRSAC